MPQTLTEAELQARHRRRRRWVVGILLGVMLVLLVAGVVCLSLISSSMSIEEAKRVVEKVSTGILLNEPGNCIRETKLSAAELDTLFGKYTTKITMTGVTWHSVEFVSHSTSSIERLTISWRLLNENNNRVPVFMVEDTLTGRIAWLYRWNLLKEKLGVK